MESSQKVTTEDNKIVEYVYNGDGLMVERKENGVTTRYYYNGDKIIAEGIVGTNNVVTAKASYLHGATGLIMRENEANNTRAYYLMNGHGDITEIRSATGAVVNSYSYDIWGNVITKTGDLENPFLYSGEYWDDTTKLQYLRARWYDPSVGRFINEDTYEGELNNPLSLNLYTYVYNNPLNYSDPSGNCPICIIIYAALAYGAKTAVETAPDVALDYGISLATGTPFSLWRSFGENYAYNLVPGVGEAKTVAQGQKLAKALQSFKGGKADIFNAGKNAHLISKHVAKDNNDLLKRFKDKNFTGSASTSFFDIDTAYNITTSVLGNAGNQKKISEWLISDKKNNLTLYHYGNEPIGYGYLRGAKDANKDIQHFYNATIVLKKDGDSFYVLTGYPSK